MARLDEPAGRPRPVRGDGLRRRDDRGHRRPGRVLAADPGGAPAGRGGQRRPALPVPAGGQPAGHRAAGVAVPDHRRRCGHGQPDRSERDPGRRHHGRQPAAVGPALRCGWCAGCAPAGRSWCWSGWTGRTRSACWPACPTCSTASRTSRSSATASWPRTAPPTRCSSTSGPPSSATCRSTELLWLVAASTVLVSDDPELVADAPGLGTPAVLVDGPHIPQPGDSIRSILSPAVMATIRQVLARPAGAAARTVRRPGGRAGRAGRGLDVRAVPVAAAQRAAPRRNTET